MNEGTRIAADDRDAKIASLEDRLALAMAAIREVSDRLAVVEGRAAKPAGEDETTIKGAAHVIGYSQSRVRGLIKDGRIEARTPRGRVLIKKASLVGLKRGAN
jgi:hypothetical protein